MLTTMEILHYEVFFVNISCDSAYILIIDINRFYDGGYNVAFR